MAESAGGVEAPFQEAWSSFAIGPEGSCLSTSDGAPESAAPLEPKTKEYKVYAPGVGLVKDGALVLVSRTVGK